MKRKQFDRLKQNCRGNNKKLQQNEQICQRGISITTNLRDNKRKSKIKKRKQKDHSVIRDSLKIE